MERMLLQCGKNQSDKWNLNIESSNQTTKYIMQFYRSKRILGIRMGCRKWNFPVYYYIVHFLKILSEVVNVKSEVT